MTLKLNLLLAALMILQGCALMPLEATDVKKAIYTDDSATLIKVYNSDFDLSAPLDEQGNNALHIAAIAGNHWRYERLEAKGANPFELNSRGQSPLSIIYRNSGNKRPPNWAIGKLNESRDAASDLLSQIENGYLSLSNFERMVRSQAFELNVTGVGKPNNTLALGLLELGKISYLKTLLKMGGSFESPYGVTQAPIVAAVNSGIEESVEFAASRGGNVNTRIKINERSVSLLKYAILQGNPAIVQILIDNGANTNSSPPPEHLSPLHFASAVGDVSVESVDVTEEDQIAIINLLLSEGADIEAEDSRGATALFYAAEAGRPSVVELLLEKGADPETTTSDMKTPLTVAAGRGHSDVANILRAAGSDMLAISKGGYTALHHAAKAGDMKTVRTLAQEIPEVLTRQSENGSTPLTLAITNKHVDVAVFLAKTSPESIHLGHNNGWTPLHFAVNGNRDLILPPDERVKLIKTLVEQGAPLEAINEDGLTPLFVAVLNSMSESLSLLIDAGAEVDLADPSNGRKPLMKAAWNEDLRSLDLLLKAGANPNAQDKKGRTALHHLATKNKELLSETYATMARRLIGWGANVDATDDQSNTPLMIAAESGNYAVVKALMTSNANPFLKNEMGETAELIAWEDEDYEIVRLIKYLSSLYEG